MLRKSRKHTTTRFLHRAVLFFTALSVGLALFFFFGNAQGFLDSTQSMILATLAATSLLTVLLAASLFVLETVLLIAKRRPLYIPLMAISLLCIALASSLALVSHVIMILAAGM